MHQKRKISQKHKTNEK